MGRERMLMYGVGLNDADYSTQPIDKETGKVVVCPYYRRWSSMLSRVYSDALHKRNSSYKTTTMSKEWHIFSNFKKWMEQQDWEGKDLDKDLLVPGNKEYSKDLCLFIPRELNRIIINKRVKSNPYPTGVTFYKPKNKYFSSIGIRGKAKKLGYFDTIDEAHKVYVSEKIKYLMSFIPTGDDRTDTGIRNHINTLEKERNEI